MSDPKGTEVLIYTSPDGKTTRIDVRVEGETVWLTQAEMAELFQSTKQNISLHVKNIFQEIELPEHSVVKEYLTIAKDGKKYLTKFYNLDVIISVGYMAEASSEIQQVLRQSMADLVAHMADRLKDGADGKPLKFKQSTVSNLVEFLSNFSFRNVTDDRQLQDLVGRARDILQGVAADDLRTSGDMRARVQQGMAALAVDLDGMLVKSGGRKMRLAEEVEP